MEDDEVVEAKLQCFSEVVEVKSLLDDLAIAVKDMRKKEIAQQRFRVILDKYQEQPHLLDPHLGTVVSQLLSIAREDPLSQLSLQAFRYLYWISKVRGSKVIVRWFSHEVSDLEPVLDMIESQDPTHYQTWETRYILLLWLSIIVMIPFNLCLLDGDQQSHHHNTLDRILALGQTYVLQSDKTRDAAAILCSRVLTRPDVQNLKLTAFLEWCKNKLSSFELGSAEGMAGASGIMATLASIFKLSKRDDIENYAPDVLRTLQLSNTLKSRNSFLRKLGIKLAQRVGMVFLPARVASWRYQRGLRSISDTLSSAFSQRRQDQTKDIDRERADEDVEVREEVEEVLDILLCGLRDCETIVRWSAAKGIGRVTGRLPQSLADDVLQSVLDCFSPREGDGTWHGGCLAVAELGRRGLLLPSRLCDVIPGVLDALVFDEMRGTHSVGAHVRDAACYICWAFARAYEPQQLRSHIVKLACGLLVTAVFDREVNCRKAAAAAFQENVGRQGTFPHGIDILTNVDYFAVGSRTNTYLNLSVYVAQFSEYAQPLVDHLVQRKLGHWDSSLRELAADALHKLTPRVPEHMHTNVLPKLPSLVLSSDPRLSHGALHALTQITTALYSVKCSPECSLSDMLGEELVQQLVDLIPQLEKRGAFRGIAGELMRLAALNFISSMCDCGLPVLSSLSVLESWQKVIDANLSHVEQNIREAAAVALYAVSSTCYPSLSSEHNNHLIHTYLSGLSSPLPLSRLSCCLALGALSRPLLTLSLTSILNGLVGVASDIIGCDPQFAEARRDAVVSISRICREVGVADDGLTQEKVDTIFCAMSSALNDHTVDARGDIGVIVREAAMTAVTDICLLLSSTGKPEMAKTHIQLLVSLLLQQANGKIDRTRSLACSKLGLLLNCQPPLEGLPHYDILASLFQQSQEDVNWAVASKTFPVTIKLLDIPEYSYHTLLGVVTSCGGLTESTMRSSRAAVLDYLKTTSMSLDHFSDTLVEVFRQNKGISRVTVPLMITVDVLLSNAVFDEYVPLPQQSFPDDLLTLVKEEVVSTTDTKKLLASVNVFCGLLQFPTVRRKVLNKLMIMICHKFPLVRRGTADQLYATFVTYDGIIPEEVADEICSVLADTKWESTVQVARSSRNQICDLLDLPRPIMKTSGREKQGKSLTKDELASYRDLVDRAGY